MGMYVFLCVSKINGNLHFTLATFISTVKIKWHFLAVFLVHGLSQALKECVVN